VSVTAIEASSNLVLGEVPGVHDSKAPVVPGAASVGLAICCGIAAAAGTARVRESAADLASSTHGRVGLTSVSDVEIRLVSTDCVTFSATANAVWDPFDTVVRDNIEVGVGPLGQEALWVGKRCCRRTCGKKEKRWAMKAHDECAGWAV
jgi:hypothetical protein